MSTITEKLRQIVGGGPMSGTVQAVWNDAAWYYPKPSPAARKIKDHVAFWHGVKVQRAPAA